MALPLPCKDRSTHDNNFDFLRFFFACLVIFSHCYLIVHGNYGQEPLFVLSRGYLTIGAVAVMGFLTISGYLVSQSWERTRTVGGYLKKRALRIYPGFLAAALFCLLVAGPLGTTDLAAYRSQNPLPHYFLRTAVLLEPKLSPVFTNTPLPNTMDSSLWTIRYEFLCYFLVIGLGILGSRSRRGALVLFGGCWVGNIGLLVSQHFGLNLPAAEKVTPMLSAYLNPPSLFFCCLYFLAGAVYYHYRHRIIRSPRLAILALAILLLSFLKPVLLMLLLPLCGTYLLFYFAFHDRIDLHAFSARGDFSYGLYLYSFPLQQLLVNSSLGRWHPLTLFASVFPITLGCAILSWYGIERPFLKKKPT